MYNVKVAHCIHASRKFRSFYWFLFLFNCDFPEAFLSPCSSNFLMAHPYQMFNWYSPGSRVFHLLRSIFQSSFWLYVLFYLSVTDNDRYCPLIKRVRTTSRAEGFWHNSFVIAVYLELSNWLIGFLSQTQKLLKNQTETWFEALNKRFYIIRVFEWFLPLLVNPLIQYNISRVAYVSRFIPTLLGMRWIDFPECIGIIRRYPSIMTQIMRGIFFKTHRLCSLGRARVWGVKRIVLTRCYTRLCKRAA